MQQSPVLQSLGSISVRRFMREYWQRKPLLIRAAWPAFEAPIGKQRLFELAQDADVESRLISKFKGRWAVQHGPFARLPSSRRSQWTLLVQGVDLHDDAARALLSRFRFVPDARLDDLMISYATDGGGVGPHIDSYDVFLLQASGRRRWRISRQRDLQVKHSAEINVVTGFRASREWILDPGDMLYLPPGVAHEGTAIGECMTYSIGFRAPSYPQLLEPLFADFAERTEVSGRYADAGAAMMLHPARLPSKMVQQIHAKLARHRPGIGDTERFLLRYFTEPKATTVFEPPSAMRQAGFRSQATARGLALHRKTRLIYSGDVFGINGEFIEPAADSVAALKALADNRVLVATRVPASVWPLLRDWFNAGWITFND